MVDKEMLMAMEELLDRKLDEKLDRKFDEKLKPVNCKLDRLDERMSGLEASTEELKESVNKLDKRTSRLEASTEELKESVNKLDERTSRLEESVNKLDKRTSRLEEFAKRIDRRTFGLKLDAKEIKVKQLENNIIPRLNTIEAYYTSTLRMYREKAELIDQMNYDVDNLKITVEKHSTRLNTVAAMAL